MILRMVNSRQGQVSGILAIIIIYVFSPVIFAVDSASNKSNSLQKNDPPACPADMNKLDCTAMVMGWTNWVPDGLTATECSDSSASIPSGTPEQNGRAIFNFLTSSNRLKPHQAAGVIGNITHESGIQPLRLQGTPSGKETKANEVTANPSSAKSGWGLVQWTPATKFIDAVGVNKADDLGVQIGFVWDQLEGRTGAPEVRAGNDIKATNTIEEAVLAFQGNTKVGGKYYGYERPNDQSGSVASRKAAAIAALAKYGSGESSSTGTIVCGEDNQLVGGYSLPVEKKWFASNPDWFAKAHHSAPAAADIPVPSGTNVYSMTAGKITKAPIKTDHTSYGAGVEIDAGNGITIIYAHGNDGGSVQGAKQGDTVRPGQLIMHSASDGNSTGPHLHLEVRINGREVCPQPLLVALGKSSTTLPTLQSLPSSGCY